MQYENIDIEEHFKNNFFTEYNDLNYDFDKYYNTKEIKRMYFKQKKLPDTSTMNLVKELEQLEE